MAFPGAKAEGMLAGIVMVSAALPALVSRLVSNGTLNRANFLTMRDTGLQLTADLRPYNRSAAQVAGERLKDAVVAWQDMGDAMSGNLGAGA